MSAEVVVKPKSISLEAPAAWSRISSVRFRDVVPFNGTEAPYVAPTAINGIQVWPARMEADGSIVRIGANQRADGLAFERHFISRADNKANSERIFVSWANIKSVSY
jgi:hypothetical protein